MNPVAIIQARLGSTRFPRKILSIIHGQTMLGRVIDRVKRSRVRKVVVAVPTSDMLEIWRACPEVEDVIPFDDQNDVLGRYVAAAEAHQADPIVRVTADCPLVDPKVIDALLGMYSTREFDYVCNNLYGMTYPGDPDHRDWPLGLDVEVFSRKALMIAHDNATDAYEREHVTPLIRSNYRDLFRLGHLPGPGMEFAKMRLTVDTPFDLELVRGIWGLFR